MISLGEMRNGFAGSWRILKGDPQGMRYFDVSVDGFWRSFGLIVPLLLPVLVGVAAERALILSRTGMDARDFPNLLFILMQILSYAGAWFGFPLLLAAVAGPLGLATRYSPLVVVRNWSSLLGMVPFFVSTLLYAVGLVSTQALAFLTLVSLIFNLYLGYQVTRIAALVPPATAVGIVFMDLVFTLLVANLCDRLVGV
ncbi:hypothetical protein [Prosthecomicrobium sp. N25]|uniref:hypothetical protein n=1 Tax=Prosthecomicrobium sp. N25 TaxID=3129254 RepID=UPI003076E8E4